MAWGLARSLVVETLLAVGAVVLLSAAQLHPNQRRLVRPVELSGLAGKLSPLVPQRRASMLLVRWQRLRGLARVRRPSRQRRVLELALDQAVGS